MTINNLFTVIPELVLGEYITKILEWVRLDTLTYENNEEKMFLYRTFKPYNNQLKFQKVDYFVQSKEIFTRDIDDDRALKLHFGFDKERKSISYLSLIEESDTHHSTTLGNGEGLSNYEIKDDAGFNYPVYSAIRHGVFNLSIISNNNNELIIIYNLLKSVLLTYSQSLEIAGLQDVKISGRMDSRYDSLVPDALHKDLKIEFIYRHNSPDVFSIPDWSDIIFNGTMINND